MNVLFALVLEQNAIPDMCTKSTCRHAVCKQHAYFRSERWVNGEEHSRHSLRRCALSAPHWLQRLYIFFVNQFVNNALPPRMATSKSRFRKSSIGKIAALRNKPGRKGPSGVCLSRGNFHLGSEEQGKQQQNTACSQSRNEPDFWPVMSDHVSQGVRIVLDHLT